MVFSPMRRFLNLMSRPASRRRRWAKDREHAQAGDPRCTRVSRPLLETLEDRLPPGDAILGLLAAPWSGEDSAILGALPSETSLTDGSTEDPGQTSQSEDGSFVFSLDFVPSRDKGTEAQSGSP